MIADPFNFGLANRLEGASEAYAALISKDFWQLLAGATSQALASSQTDREDML